jgi:glycine/serine hydroxymethyltransferase
MSHTILHTFTLDLELNDDATEKQKEDLLAELEDTCRKNDIVNDIYDTSQEQV